MDTDTHPPDDTADRWMTARETAAYLGMSVDNLYVRRHQGRGLAPPGYKVLGRLRYRRSEVDAWVREHAEQSDR